MSGRGRDRGPVRGRARVAGRGRAGGTGVVHAVQAVRTVRVALALAVATLLFVGCAGWTTDPALTLHVDSRIDRPLLVYVNDDWVGTIPAGATDAVVPASGHGGPPWTAEGRVASGTVLITLPIPAAPGPGDGITTTAVTACGTITMTVGAPDPGPSLAPPAQGAELPPCD